MTIQLWKTLLTSFLLTLLGIGGLALFASFALVNPPPKRFMTPVFQMDLSDGWTCDQEGMEWVCSPPGPRPSDSIAVIAMKNRGPQDSLKAYTDHLRSPVELRLKDGSVRTSDVELVDTRRIGGYEWAEALHLGSEVPNYYTHYLATVTSHIGTLVTFSAHKDQYERLNAQLERMIGSLLVYQRAFDANGGSAVPDTTMQTVE